MLNAHTGGAVDQTSEDGTLFQENKDEAKAEGCLGCELMRGDGVQSNRESGRQKN